MCYLGLQKEIVSFLSSFVFFNGLASTSHSVGIIHSQIVLREKKLGKPFFRNIRKSDKKRFSLKKAQSLFAISKSRTKPTLLYTSPIDVRHNI